MTFRLVVDIRERHVIGHIDVPYQTEQLDVGDFHILQGDSIYAIWERKTYADLCASVKDSRYREQKHRLLAANAKVHGYIIEGSRNARHGLPEDTIDSILLGLTVRDGFSVLYTTDAAHSARMLGKMIKKFPEYSNHTQNHTDALIQGSISTIKSENYTPELCYLAQLAQIPGVSTITAQAIARVYPNIGNLVDLLRTPDGTKQLSQLYVGDKRLGVTATKIYNYMCGVATPTKVKVTVMKKSYAPSLEKPLI